MDKITRAPRFTYLTLARVRDLATDRKVGYIGNISTGGLMLFVNQKLSRQDRRTFAIDFPHPTRGKITIQVGVRIAWHKRDYLKARQQNAGCEIVAIEPEDRLALLQSAGTFGAPA